jgi:hypothetical protein
VAAGGRTQAGGEVAETGADRDAGAQRQDGGLDLGRALGRASSRPEKIAYSVSSVPQGRSVT